MRDQLALITGATSGIGEATAEVLAERGARLILTGRREDRLQAIAERLAKTHGTKVLTLQFDVSDRAATEAALGSIATELKELSILVNSAGLARGTDPVQNARIDDWDEMIDTNVKGLLYVTRLCLPHLISRRGHIVNLGSTAGRWTYYGGAVYCASKFAVRALSEGIRMDTAGTGVRLTNIEPGKVETEFSEVRFRGDKEKAAAVYRGSRPLTARDVAETIAWCLERPAHVNVQELVLYPTDQPGPGPTSPPAK